MYKPLKWLSGLQEIEGVLSMSVPTLSDLWLGSQVQSGNCQISQSECCEILRYKMLSPDPLSSWRLNGDLGMRLTINQTRNLMNTPFLLHVEMKKPLVCRRRIYYTNSCGTNWESQPKCIQLPLYGSSNYKINLQIFISWRTVIRHM